MRAIRNVKTLAVGVTKRHIRRTDLRTRLREQQGELKDAEASTFR